MAEGQDVHVNHYRHVSSIQHIDVTITKGHLVIKVNLNALRPSCFTDVTNPADSWIPREWMCWQQSCRAIIG